MITLIAFTQTSCDNAILHCLVIACSIEQDCNCNEFSQLVQERLTKDIAKALLTAVKPTGVGVVIEAWYESFDNIVVTKCSFHDFYLAFEGGNLGFWRLESQITSDSPHSKWQFRWGCIRTNDHRISRQESYHSYQLSRHPNHGLFLMNAFCSRYWCAIVKFRA